MIRQYDIDMTEINLTIKVSDGEFVDAKQLTYDELAHIKMLLCFDVAQIKAQISEAQSRLHSEGVYSDTKWYNKAKSALSFKQQHIQVVQLLMGIKKREEKNERKKNIRVQSQEKRAEKKRRREGRDTIAQFFIDECKNRMDEDVFDKLMHLALNRFEEGQENSK